MNQSSHSRIENACVIYYGTCQRIHFIGWDVYKKWGDFGVCHGMVVSTQWRKFSQISKTREVMTWTVVYDDQESEDLTTEEMEKWSIDCI